MGVYFDRMVVFAGAGFGYAKVKSVTEYSSKMQVYVTVPKTSDKVLIRIMLGIWRMIIRN